MSYLNLLKAKEVPDEILESKEVVSTLQEKKEKPVDVLRRANKKIKLVTPTSFGTQIEFMKLYDEDEIKELLKDFSIKIKNKSVFIVD